MKNLQIIIQARTSSTRLPGKVLLPLCGKTVLEIMISRLDELRNNIIIATTNNGSEAPIVDLCKQLNIPFFRGSEYNVLERFYGAATEYGADNATSIVRLTSDCPLIDKFLCKEAISKHQSGKFDLVNIGPHSGFPRGLDVSVFSYDLLKHTYCHAKNENDLEHVTLGMPKFRETTIFNICESEDLSDIRLTLDENDDYLVIKEVFKQFNNSVDFTYNQLKLMLKNNEYICKINSEVVQKSTR